MEYLLYLLNQLADDFLHNQRKLQEEQYTDYGDFNVAIWKQGEQYYLAVTRKCGVPFVKPYEHRR